MDTDGYLLKYKACMVVQGNLQQFSFHEEIYAATLASRTVRAIMALAAYFGLDTMEMNAVSAFTNSATDKEVYIRCPEDFLQPGKCLRLKRALYGLRRSPLL